MCQWSQQGIRTSEGYQCNIGCCSSRPVDPDVFVQKKVRRLSLLFLSMKDKSFPWPKGVSLICVDSKIFPFGYLLVYELIGE